MNDLVWLPTKPEHRPDGFPKTEPDRQGRGSMILLRLPSETGGDGGGNFGEKLVEKLREARKLCGLEGRFAIIVDLETDNKSKGPSTLRNHMKSEHEDLQKH